MKNRILYLITLVLAFSAFNSECHAQSKERKLVREGNKHYEENKFTDAEVSYRKSLEKNPSSEIANFNLADAIYKQQKYEEAAGMFNNIASNTTDKDLKAKAYHNLGNSYLKTEKYAESVEAYKNSLLNNPKDEQSKYNYAYAKMMMKQQEQQQQNKDKNDKGDNKKDQEKNQDKQENKDDKNKDKQEQEQKQQEQAKEEQQKQPKPGEMSKKEAEQLLEALSKNEKDVRDKLKKEKAAGVKVQVEKDW